MTKPVLSIAAGLIVSMCSIGHAVDLYQGSLGTSPDAQGWLKFNTDGNSSPVTAANKTTFDTSAMQAERGGFSNYNLIFPVNGAFPSLNRATGYTVSLDMKMRAESHASNDRSGVGLIVLSSDLFGVELEFWQNEIWVQSGADFLHAEGVAFNTTTVNTSYDLAVHGSTYDVFANGNPVAILSGNLRNYSAFGLPYSLPNFLFLGDDTTSASGSFEFSRLSVNVPEPTAMLIAISLSGFGLYRQRNRIAA
ncbi:hypothetical protein BH09PLA1_BH09PLA1_13990 [soil metagenome]